MRVISILIIVLFADASWEQQQQQLRDGFMSMNVDQVRVALKNQRHEFVVEAVDKDFGLLDFTHVDFMSDKPNYQIQLNITLTEQVSLFTGCAIGLSAFNSSATRCLTSFYEIVDGPNVTLKINRRLIKSEILISHRLIISGCDERTQLKRLVFQPNMPMILHYSDLDCLYAIDMRAFPKDMLKITMAEFPHANEQQCKASIQISNTNANLDLNGSPQAYFDRMQDIREFGAEVIVSSRIALIRLANCFENSEPISLKLERVSSKLDIYELLICYVS